MKILLTILIGVLSSYCHAAIKYHTQLYQPKGKNYNIPRKNAVISGYFSPTESGDGIWLLYAKEPGDQFSLAGLLASKSLEKILPSKVLKFIANRIVNPKLSESNSLNTAKEALRAAVEKALGKTWLNAMVNEGDAFAHLPEYDRNNAGFDMNYYEFFPIERNDITNPTTIDDAYLKSSLFDSAALAPEKMLLEKNGELRKVEDDVLKKPDFDRSIKWQKHRYENLMEVRDKLISIDYHHKNIKVSDWPQPDPKHWGLPKIAPADFHADVDTACKYLMVLQPVLKKSELMPAMAWKQNYGNWKATRCNIFAGDFIQQKLKLGKYPWSSRDWTADVIYDALPKDGNFVPLDWNEVWFYATIGYPVVITTPRPVGGDAAHIGFAFPIELTRAEGLLKKDENDAIESIITDGEGVVLQAGKTIGKVSYAKSFYTNKRARIYVYLGHILN